MDQEGVVLHFILVRQQIQLVNGPGRLGGAGDDMNALHVGGVDVGSQIHAAQIEVHEHIDQTVTLVEVLGLLVLGQHVGSVGLLVHIHHQDPFSLGGHQSRQIDYCSCFAGTALFDGGCQDQRHKTPPFCVFREIYPRFCGIFYVLIIACFSYNCQYKAVHFSDFFQKKLK